MYMISIDAEKCEGCNECIDGCPVNILEMTDGKAVVIDGSESDCMGCETCVVVCPTAAPVIEEM
ncbi:MAG: 4Fe-4S binding protein [Desulfotomaculum sp.]|nr:4Fe-4S binding protein [Desulfotomaculum sp.]MCL0081222.1 4Fe-4S binding protein [Peptococcaceae bacterium]